METLKQEVRRWLLVFAGCLVVASWAGAAVAIGVAQGYLTDDTGLKPGMVVQLVDGSGDGTKVERGSSEEPKKVIGLATGAGDTTVVIANSQQKTYVQTTGEANALVSDINGEVKQGDQLTISPIRGILMKSSGNGSINFATALEDFATVGAQSYDINGGTSGKSSTLVARVKVSLDGRSFANQGSQSKPSTLAQIGVSLVGRNVGEARVVVALLIFLIALVAEGGIIYGAVSSAITALGRNPLANKEIKRELFRVLLVAMGVLLISLAAIYGVLWV